MGRESVQLHPRRTSSDRTPSQVPAGCGAATRTTTGGACAQAAADMAVSLRRAGHRTRRLMDASPQSEGTHKTAHPFPLRRADLVFHELDGEAVLFDPRHGAVHRFDALTLLVWNACDGSRAEEAVAALVVGGGGLTRDEALAGVEAVLAELRTRDLLQSASDCRGDVAKTEPATVSKERQPRSPDAEAPTRREALAGGAFQMLVAAPVISTFFAAGAFASGPSYSQAFGTDAGGGCKTVLYSCAVNNDCCEDPVKTACENNVPAPGKHCCIQANEACTTDAECCANKVCPAGTCVP